MSRDSHSDSVSLRALLDRLQKVKKTGNGHKACCPAHEDDSPSLSIGLGDDGRILLKCHAGCAVEDIVAAIGMTMADLMAPADSPMADHERTRTKRPPRTYATLQDAVYASARGIGTIEVVYEYPSADGTTDFAVVRIMQASGKKTFRPLHRVEDKWLVGDPPGLLPLFKLPTLPSAEQVLVVEGEKCALAAAGLGFVVTTSSHGADSAIKTDWAPLAGKHVAILPDNDDPGRNYANDVVQELARLSPAASVRILELPNLPVGGDIVDWLEARRGSGIDDPGIKEELCLLLDAASEQKPGSEKDCVDSVDSVEGGPRSGWPNPRPIKSVVTLPPFPLEAFFPPHLSFLRDYFVAVGEGYQFPVDAVVMMGLPCMALTLCKRFEVQAQPLWTEPLSIYSVPLLPSGERKSSCLNHLLRPIHDWQREQSKAMRDQIVTFENELKIAKAKLSKAREQATNDDEDFDSQKLLELAKKVHELEQSEPRPPQLIVTEATSEALVRVLVENDERALLAAAEGDAFEVMLGRYSRNPNMGIWLSGHAGDSMDIVRLGRPADRLVRPSLQVCLCVQPAAVHDLLANKNADGLGLLARFLFIAPHSRVGFREINPPDIPGFLKISYENHLRHHLRQTLDGTPRYIQLTAGAKHLLDRFREDVETELREYGALSHVPAWGSKLPGTLLRIAGIFAAFDPNREPVIDEQVLACALALKPYLFAHYEHVLDMAGGNPDLALARKIDHWLIRQRITSSSVRDVHTKFRAAARKVDELKPALQILIDLNRIRAIPAAGNPGAGRPASPRFELNPALLQTEAPPAQNPHNPQNARGAAEDRT